MVDNITENMTAAGEDNETANAEQPKQEIEVKKEETEKKEIDPHEPVIPPKATKETVRKETWSKMDKALGLVFRRPYRHRIPRFEDESAAAQKLSELDVFKNAKVVKVTLDKAHESVRLQLIEAGKELIVGAPGLREAVFLHVRPPADNSRSAIRNASTRFGIAQIGTALDFDSETKADLIVVAAVAVDKKGHRIGKGEGFSDLEFALLSKLGVIKPDVPVVAVVHDLQVYEELPEEMFQPFDVPLDIIVTPTQVIKVEKPLPRPCLQWNLLSNRRVNNIPIIKQLLDREQSQMSTPIVLKEVDSDMEEKQTRMRMKGGRRFSQRRREMSAPERRGPPRDQPREGSAPPAPRTKSRTFRRRFRNPETSPNEPTPTDGVNQNIEGNKGGKGGGRGRGGLLKRKMTRPRYPVEFSVRVDGLTSGIRVRDLKAALIERGVRPRDISWRGTKGVALLHFSKTKANPETPVAVDDIVASLQGLKVKADGDDGAITDLNVEPASPITRIEVVDIASV